MAQINFPKSLQMNAQEPAARGAEPLITRFRSDNSSYNSGDIIKVEISTGGRGQYLLPGDSYLSFDFTHTWTGGATTTKIDACAYSMFRRARIIHGSTVLVDTQHVGRLWNALRDIQVSSASRAVDEIRMAVQPFATQAQTCNGMVGLNLVSGQTYDAAFPLPLPLVGTLQKSAVPLGLMGASSLYIELEIAPTVEIITHREFADADGAVPALGANTYVPGAFTLSNIYYNAKITTLDDTYNAALMSVYAGRPLMLPAVDYIGEQKVIQSGSVVINEKFAFSRSSVNGCLWWLSNSAVANGATYDASGGRLDGTTHRQGGPLDQHYMAISGKNLLPVYAGANGTVLGASTYFKGANSVNQIGRIFDNMSTVEGMGVLNFKNYCSGVDTALDAAAVTKRFVGAYSMERYDASSQYASGSNLIGQDVRLVVQFTGSGLTAQQNLYAFAMCDVGFELVDGQLSLRA